MSVKTNWLLLTIIVYVHIWHVELCGIITHIDVGERGSEFFDAVIQDVDYRQLIKQHEDAFQAGSPYPDAYYPDLCRSGVFHQVAEDAHWTPFLNVSINYIRENYPQPWDTATEKLVVFLMGITQHQIADVSWHSLGIPQGFLRAMGNINFHGSFDAAHGVGDFGGDVINRFELDMSYVGTIGKWYVPTEDMLEIHRNYYDDYIIDTSVIEDCTRLLYLGRLGEMTGAVELVFPLIAARSPFLVDRLNDYFLGGMDDMAAWSARTWGRVARMIDEGTDICDLPENPIYITCDGEKALDFKSDSIEKRPNQISRDMKNQYLSSQLRGMQWDDVIMERTERGVEFRPGDRILQLLAEKNRYAEAVQQEHESSTRSDVDPAAIYETREIYSRLGESLLMADVNNDGYDDLVIGAPGYGSMGNANQGRVYVVYGSAEGLPETNMIVEDEADVILNGPGESGRFGTALAVVDLDSDGFNDLVVSAPQVGSSTLDYQGEVYVYFGASSRMVLNPDVTIKCEERYCNLGWSLAGADLTGDGFTDLLIGAPFAPAGGEQRGFVGAIYSSQNLERGSTFSFNDLDWVEQGEQNYDWFGYSLATEDNRIFIGAPSHRQCHLPDCSYDPEDIEAIGKTYLFSGEDPPWTFLGSDTFDQQGYFVHQGAFTYAELVTGAITSGTSQSEFNQPGSVFILNPPSQNLNQTGFNLVGDRSYSRFGHSVRTVDLDGDGAQELLVGAPLRTESREFLFGAEEGRVFVYSDSEGIPELSLELTLGESKSRFGYSMATVLSPDKVTLTVSAPHSNAGARLGGRVAVFSF